MQLEIQVKTRPECIDFLQLEYEGKLYTLDQFASTFKNGEFQLDAMLPRCNIAYRGKTISFEEYRYSLLELSNQLGFSQKYGNEIVPIEIYLAICNFNFYKAAKFLEKAENCLQTARYYLIQGSDILEYDCNVSWQYGYQPIYEIRTINFTTAIVWYNNCFDYILLIAFLAFELYKSVRRYKPEMAFEEIISLCTFRVFRDLHREHADNVQFTQLWNIIDDCHNLLTEINTWANYAKHKGGIGYIGLKPESPFQIHVESPDGTTESRTSDFESIKLDMEKSVPILVNAHKALLHCIDELVEFINFRACKYELDENGKMVIPETSTYVKISLGSGG